MKLGQELRQNIRGSVCVCVCRRRIDTSVQLERTKFSAHVRREDCLSEVRMNWYYTD